VTSKATLHVSSMEAASLAPLRKAVSPSRRVCSSGAPVVPPLAVIAREASRASRKEERGARRLVAFCNARL